MPRQAAALTVAMMDDPTFSRALRIDYARTLVNIVRRFRKEVLEYAKIVQKPQQKEQIVGFAKDTSYDPKKYLQSLKTKVGDRAKAQIQMAIQHMMLHGANLARRHLSLPQRPRFNGRYINVGTMLELARVNVDLVQSIQQNHLKRLKLLVARSIGAGKLTWNKFVKGIKALGDISDAEAERIARTETVRTVTAAQAEEYTRNGITKWMWITQKDERVCKVCRPLHGKVVRIGDPFTTARGQSIIKPPAHPNCRCGVQPIT